MVQFDHIEIHVKNSKRYVEFLQIIFKGGRFKKISENNTYMYLSPDLIRFEVKENSKFQKKLDLNVGIGFCLPCLRMKNASKHLDSLEGVEINKVLDNPDGKCIFFKDYEGIEWHIKDYEILDVFVNI